MTENQKLREALQKAKDALSLALSDVDWRKDSPTQPVIHKAYNCAHQALALPTAEQVDDINVAESFTSVTKTAAPVGERELPPLPSYARWEERIKMLMQQCGHPNSMSIYQAFKQFQNEFEHEMIAYARAALSAGDAVDAQRYRWLADCNNYEAGLALIIDPKLTEQALDAAIDAAMRKDKP